MSAVDQTDRGERAALTFVIPVRNDAKGLRRCLQSIRAASPPGTLIDIIVIDNASEDASADVARSMGAAVIHLANRPVAALRNAGAAGATGALLAFVDADHELVPGWIGSALELMADPGIGAAGAPYWPPPDATWVQRAYNGLRDHRPEQTHVQWLGSGNMVVRAELFRRAGGFDETLEACEDVDLSRRLRQAGGSLVSDARLHSVHYGDPASLRALFRSELWRGRNNLKVSFREHLSWRMMPSILIPVFDMGILAAATAAAVIGRPVVSLALVGAYALPSVMRAAVVRRRSGISALHAFALALVYDTARALALVWRKGHRRARIGRSA